MNITVTREELVEIIEAAFDLGYKKGTEQHKITNSNTGTFSAIHSNGSLGIVTQMDKENYTGTVKPYGMEFKYNGTER